jgi:hypothetical protein
MSAIVIKPIDANDVGVFISYAKNKNERDKLMETLKNNGITCWADSRIEAHEDDYLRKIIDNIKNNGVGVLICTEEILSSEFVAYELGLLRSFNKPVICYFPEGTNKFELPSMLDGYPIVYTLKDLISHIREQFYFKDLLINDNVRNKKIQDNVRNKKIQAVALHLNFTETTLKREALQFGCILVSLSCFGSLCNDKGDMHPEDKCLFTNGTRNEKECVRNNDRDCAGLADLNIEDFPETVILNHILTGNTLELNEGYWIAKYVLPVQANHGLTFKCFVDVNEQVLSKYDLTKYDVKTRLERNGFHDVSLSGSAEGNRIYFLLPEPIEDKEKRLTCVRDPIVTCILNNYLCPICLQP